MMFLSVMDPARLQNLWWAVLTSITILIAGAVAKSLIALIKSKLETERVRRHAIDELAKIAPQLVSIAAVFEQTARDAKEAKDLSRQQIEMSTAHSEEIAGLKRDVSGIKSEIHDLRKWEAREIVHRVRNDLAPSKLAKEAEELLAEEDGQVKP